MSEQKANIDIVHLACEFGSAACEPELGFPTEGVWFPQLCLACALVAVLLWLLALKHQGHAEHAQAGKSCNQEENPHSHCVGQKCQY
jgi:hypothetical protein